MSGEKIPWLDSTDSTGLNTPEVDRTVVGRV